MTRVTADISVSLDGFVTGPGPSPGNRLGTGGEALHTRAFSDDPDVILMGGATTSSALDAGLVGALTLHLVPIVLGAGTPVFTGGAPRTLMQRSVISTSTATHLTYDVPW
jgi:dihydrofolate reductase